MTDVAAFEPLFRHQPLGLGLEPNRTDLELTKTSQEEFPQTEEVASEEKKPQWESKIPAKVMRGVLLSAALVGLGVGSEMGYFDPLFEVPAIQRVSERMSQLSRPYLVRIAENFPWAEIWISPIPQLDDVSPEEFEELKQAARASLKKRGPQFALGLSRRYLRT